MKPDTEEEKHWKNGELASGIYHGIKIADEITDDDTDSNTHIISAENRHNASTANSDENVYTEESLREEFDVDFIRTPLDEYMIFDNPTYLGLYTVQNSRYDYVYKAHIWLVRFIRVNSIDFATPMKGLLQIRKNRWCYGHWPNPERAFKGRCSILADERKRILSVDRTRFPQEMSA